MNTTPKKRTRRRAALAIGGAVLMLTGGAYALTMLNVAVPLMPAVGDRDVNACDEDGVTTSFTYGNASNNGIKVSAVKVTGISSQCKTGDVYFLATGNPTPIANYSGTVTANALDVATNVWTFNFDTVRVVLFP